MLCEMELERSFRGQGQLVTPWINSADMTHTDREELEQHVWSTLPGSAACSSAVVEEVCSWRFVTAPEVVAGLETWADLWTLAQAQKQLSSPALITAMWVKARQLCAQTTREQMVYSHPRDHSASPAQGTSCQPAACATAGYTCTPTPSSSAAPQTPITLSQAPGHESASSSSTTPLSSRRTGMQDPALSALTSLPLTPKVLHTMHTTTGQLNPYPPLPPSNILTHTSHTCTARQLPHQLHVQVEMLSSQHQEEQSPSAPSSIYPKSSPAVLRVRASEPGHIPYRTDHSVPSVPHQKVGTPDDPSHSSAQTCTHPSLEQHQERHTGTMAGNVNGHPTGYNLHGRAMKYCTASQHQEQLVQEHQQRHTTHISSDWVISHGPDHVTSPVSSKSSGISSSNSTTGSSTPAHFMHEHIVIHDDRWQAGRDCTASRSSTQPIDTPATISLEGSNGNGNCRNSSCWESSQPGGSSHLLGSFPVSSSPDGTPASTNHLTCSTAACGNLTPARLLAQSSYRLGSSPASSKSVPVHSPAPNSHLSDTFSVSRGHLVCSSSAPSSHMPYTSSVSDSHMPGSPPAPSSHQSDHPTPFSSSISPSRPPVSITQAPISSTHFSSRPPDTEDIPVSRPAPTSSTLAQAVYRKRMLQWLMRATDQAVDALRPIQCAHIVFSLGKLGICNQQLIHKIVQQTAPHLQGLPSIAATNMCWACAKLGVQPEREWLEDVCSIQALRFSDMPPKTLVALIWSVATLAPYIGPEWAASAAASLTGRIHRLTQSELNNLIWALATMQVKTCATSSSPAQPSIHSVNEVHSGLQSSTVIDNPSQLCTSFLPAFFKYSATRLCDYDPRMLVGTISSLARMRASPPVEWMNAFCAAVLHHLPGLDARQASLLLWALAKLRRVPPLEWSVQVVDQFHSLRSDWQAGDVVSVVWSISSVTHMHTHKFKADRPAFVTDLVASSYPSLPQYNAAQLVQIVDGFAKMRHYPGVKWMQSHERACGRHKFSAQNQAKVRQAYQFIWNL